MRFWKRRKKEGTAPVYGGRSPSKGKRFPAEVKLLAVQAKEAGLDRAEVAKLVGASPYTVDKWFLLYRDHGPDALIRQSSHPSTRKVCAVLESRIEECRRANPEMGVRRISDELKRNEGLKVSPETVRRVVNDADPGNPPPSPKVRAPQVRRFERQIPNALWQIDIFTFELKRMYRVYLVGIIDDHARYIVSHGLFRQQTADAVLEVVRGATGQWGAPREILSDKGMGQTGRTRQTFSAPETPPPADQRSK